MKIRLIYIVRPQHNYCATLCRGLIVLFYLFSTAAHAELIFYPLQHKTPKSIIPSIEPFLKSGETISAANNELILRVNKGSVLELKKIINKLDSPSHRLIVYVNRDGKFKPHTQGYNINFTSQMTHQHRNKGKLTVYSTHQRSNDNNNQSIQVLDGHTAHISSGINEPIHNIQTINYGRYSHTSSNTEYREASTGFYVTPHLHKESVTLEIAPWSQQALSENSAPTFMRASSVIRGNLNTWIELSGINEQASNNSTGILHKHRQTTINNQQIWFKVVDLDAIKN